MFFCLRPFNLYVAVVWCLCEMRVIEFEWSSFFFARQLRFGFCLCFSVCDLHLLVIFSVFSTKVYFGFYCLQIWNMSFGLLFLVHLTHLSLFRFAKLFAILFSLKRWFAPAITFVYIYIVFFFSFHLLIVHFCVSVCECLFVILIRGGSANHPTKNISGKTREQESYIYIYVFVCIYWLSVKEWERDSIVQDRALQSIQLYSFDHVNCCVSVDVFLCSSHPSSNV